MPKKMYKLVSTPMIFLPSILEFFRHDYKHGFATRDQCFQKLRPVWTVDSVPDRVINALVDGNYTVDGSSVVVEVEDE